MDVSLMAVGTQFMGNDLGTRPARSTQTQRTDANLRAAGTRQTDDSLRADTICPYP